MSNLRTNRRLAAASPHRLTVCLPGCTALTILAPLSGVAQDVAPTGNVIVLDQITLTASTDDDDANSIVALQTANGSKMTQDILECPHLSR